MDYLRESDDVRREIAIARNMIRRCEEKLDALNAAWEQSSYKDKDIPLACDILTQREFQVFELVKKGFPNARIETELSLGENTVEACVAMILDKLNCRNRTELLRIES